MLGNFQAQGFKDGSFLKFLQLNGHLVTTGFKETYILPMSVDFQFEVNGKSPKY